jgi:hypothetical protein
MCVAYNNICDRAIFMLNKDYIMLHLCSSYVNVMLCYVVLCCVMLMIRCVMC